MKIFGLQFFNKDTQVYLGDEDAYQEQVITPLMASGSKKNKFAPKDAEKMSVVMTSIRILADTISRLPLHVYESTEKGNQIDKGDYRYDLLHYSPDGIITSQAFFNALEYNRNLKGNAFALINREPNTGKIISLQLLPSNYVTGYKIVRGQLYYIISDTDKNGKPREKVINSRNMLHFKGLSRNGIWGINPIQAVKQNLSTLYKAKETTDAFYENNAFTPKALKSQIPDVQFQKTFAEAMQNFKEYNVGVANAGQIMRLPPFTEIQNLSVDPVDAKFISTIELDTATIASWFGIPPHMVGIFTASKYNSVEQMSLDFKSNTISPIARMYRQELEHKLLTSEERKNNKSIEFSLQALVETDLKAKTDYYKQLFSMGVFTQNQIAALEGIPLFDGGDKHYVFEQLRVIDASVGN